MGDRQDLQDLNMFNNLLAAFGMVRGKLQLPCVPALAEHYVQKLIALADFLEKPLQPEQIQALEQTITQELAKGFQASQHSQLIISFKPNAATVEQIEIEVTSQIASLAEFYEAALKDNFHTDRDNLDGLETSVFGKHANARVLELLPQLTQLKQINQLGGSASDPDPQPIAILDIGAGAGRNALPLARMGYAVTAIELATTFCRQLKQQASLEDLPLTVVQGNILDPLLRPKLNYYALAILSELLVHFREPDQARLGLAKACDAVIKDGLVLFNIFLTRADYQPTIADRQVAQVAQSFFLTPAELTAVISGLPLEIIDQQSVFSYERDRLPAAAWPPSPWFINWSTGRLLFDTEPPPISLQWLLCRRV
jgi:2-polyprenyl-3-methyl-5-hydroxy-6-metoxy-1,4-benzoquinol methylase